MKKDNIKIGVLSYGFNQWGGGVDFIKHMLIFLDCPGHAHKNVSVTVFLPRNSLGNYFKDLLYPCFNLMVQMVKTRKFIWQQRPRFPVDQIKKTFLEFNPKLNIVFCSDSLDAQLNAANKKKIDLVFPCIDIPPKSCRLPWVGYIADFQHRHLPQYFSSREIQRRDLSFHKMLNSARHIIVYGNSVIHDANLFYPGYSAAIHALPFCPFPQEVWLKSSLDVRGKYAIHAPYFLISNQFWVHKDHVTALRAYARYCQMGGEAELVCTGKTYDPRFPNYFNEVLSLISELGIKNRVTVLGYIPKIDQVALIKKALAVVQSTLFEGGPGGGSSYDAISLGIPVIASNIPINMEMNCGDVTYFEAGNDEELSYALLNMESKVQVRKSNEELWADGLKRKKIISGALLNVLNKALN